MQRLHGCRCLWGPLWDPDGGDARPPERQSRQGEKKVGDEDDKA